MIAMVQKFNGVARTPRVHEVLGGHSLGPEGAEEFSPGFAYSHTLGIGRQQLMSRPEGAEEVRAC